MDKIITNNTKVLIFKYNPCLGASQDENIYIKGTICNSEIIEEPTMHGSPWDVTVYKVLGEDGKIYEGNYDSRISGDYYFRTIQDHIKKLKRKVKNNCDKINELNQNNYYMYEHISYLNDYLYYNGNNNEVIKSNPEYPMYKSLEEKAIVLAKKNAERYKRNK